LEYEWKESRFRYSILCSMIVHHSQHLLKREKLLDYS
jgi:hypothetical protein